MAIKALDTGTNTYIDKPEYIALHAFSHFPNFIREN